MTIKERVASKEKSIEKLQKRLQRIQTALETGKNPYYYSDYDLKSTQRDLEYEQSQLIALKDKAKLEQEKAASRNVPAITDFIEKWKSMVLDYYTQQFDAYYKDWQHVKDLYDAAFQQYNLESDAVKEYKDAQKLFYAHTHNVREKQSDGRVVENTGKYVHILPYVQNATFEQAIAKLTREINKEGDLKYDYILDRTNAIVGTITDAQELRVDGRGEINGIIYGTRGVAEVSTIFAGGYNIQCLHLRVLVKEHKPNR